MIALGRFFDVSARRASPQGTHIDFRDFMHDRQAENTTVEHRCHPQPCPPGTEFLDAETGPPK
jgi:hypothetical protein